ncbi:MAG TPA: hypothetical protein VH724_01790, partial [Candidatus Angelobacter sp.]|nr:hypothetical protein [Candidatus Angelobacter sp.]
MRFGQPKLATERVPILVRFFYLFVFAAALILAPAAQAQSTRLSVAPDVQTARGQYKLSADLANFPLNADGTVSVIIQFNQTPKAQHFADMAARGGRIKFSLDRINGAALRIPVRMLAWLQNHPDVAYVSPDRTNKVASDDNIPAVTGD